MPSVWGTRFIGYLHFCVVGFEEFFFFFFGHSLIENE